MNAYATLEDGISAITAELRIENHRLEAENEHLRNVITSGIIMNPSPVLVMPPGFATERIKELESKLTEAERREKAAVSALERYTSCQACTNMRCYRRNGTENCKFEFEPQEAGSQEGEAE